MRQYNDLRNPPNKDSAKYKEELYNELVVELLMRGYGENSDVLAKKVVDDLVDKDTLKKVGRV